MLSLVSQIVGSHPWTVYVVPIPCHDMCVLSTLESYYQGGNEGADSIEERGNRNDTTLDKKREKEEKEK
jgi:hypothetical protein